jgi:hypothetical protein
MMRALSGLPVSYRDIPDLSGPVFPGRILFYTRYHVMKITYWRPHDNDKNIGGHEISNELALVLFAYYGEFNLLFEADPALRDLERLQRVLQCVSEYIPSKLTEEVGLLLDNARTHGGVEVHQIEILTKEEEDAVEHPLPSPWPK